MTFSIEEKDTARDVALFRYGIIIPLVTNPQGWDSNMDFFREQANKIHIFMGEEKKLAINTIKDWYMKYTKGGFDALKPVKRKDAGNHAKLKDNVKERIVEIKTKFPRIKATTIKTRLMEEGLIGSGDFSISTIQRFIRNHDFDKSPNEERFAFEMENCNDLFMVDTSYTMYIGKGKDKKRTYLVLAIDDKSRVAVGGRFFFEDNTTNVQQVLKDAFKIYGVAKSVFCDNGTPYANKYIQLSMAKLGVHLIHARPYSGASKGKIERLNRTIKDDWLEVCDHSKYTSLEQLNKELAVWINNYNNKVHSSIEMTPIQRRMEDSHLIVYKDHDTIDKAFFFEEERKVNKSALISIANTKYEVPQLYIGEKVIITYDITADIKQYFLVDGDNHIPIKEVDLVANSKRKRKNNIVYSELGDGGENDV